MDRLIGVFLVALSAAFFGANTIFARICYAAGANPETFLFIRFLIASPIMFLIMVTRGFSLPRGKLLLSLTLIGGIGLSGSTLSFYTAIKFAPVNLIIIITYMYPAIVTLLASVFLKQPVTKYKIVALTMTGVGILFTIGVGGGGYFVGIILAVFAAILYSLYLIFSSVSIQKAGPYSASTVIILSSTIIYGIIVGIQGPQWPINISGWAAIIGSALISTVLPLIAFFEGIKRIDTANAAIVSTFEVVVVVALAIIILGETFTLAKLFGAFTVISAVVILAKSEYKTAQAKLSHSILK